MLRTRSALSHFALPAALALALFPALAAGQVHDLALPGGYGSAQRGIEHGIVAALAPPGTTPVGRLLPASAAGCQPSWLPMYGVPPGLNGGFGIFALTVFDDGNGPALYAGGLKTPGGPYIAKWNGANWSTLGAGTINTVYALTVFDDGSGPALYAGGNFSGAGGANYIAKWDGTSWSALGTGLGGPGLVSALTVFDDGGGPALYAGGAFTSAGGIPANRIAQWNGSSWSALGSGMNSDVRALTVFDDGNGAVLYAGGGFTTAGGVAANRVAKWNGTTWTALGNGMNNHVNALTVFDDGGGAALYAGGPYSHADGALVNGIAKWNGTSWSALGSGLTVMSGGFPPVYALASFDDGNGAALYAAGEFTAAGGSPASNIAKWNATSWSALGSGLSSGDVRALAVYADANGPALYAGGRFLVSPAGDSFVARWGCPLPPITSVPGCTGNPATLTALASSAPLGAPLPLRIAGSAAPSGLGAGLVFFGVPGIDASGCGLLLPGAGELLLALAPPPVIVASGLLTGGTCDLSPLVPNDPALNGATVYLQGVVAYLVPALPTELSNALAVKLGP